MSCDPATSAAQEVAERARRYSMILDPEVLAEVIREAVEAARPIIEAEQRSKDAAEAAVISSSRMIEKAYRLGWERAAVRTEPEQ